MRLVWPYEPGKHGLEVRRQVAMPLEYEGVALDVGNRLDLFVAQLVIVELKAIEKLLPIHRAPLLPEAEQARVGVYPRLQHRPYARWDQAGG